MIPLVHDFSGATVLVFGGGPVGARKARRFAREARVVVLSPAFEGEFGGADLLRVAPDPAEVGRWIDRADPALVVVATDDPAVDDAAAAAAREAGALVNRADRSGGRDPDSVVVPATVRDDPVVVAVATGGRSPALSRHLREQIEAEIDGAGAMARLTADLRAELADADPGDRRAVLRAVVRSESVWKGLRTGTPNSRSEAEAIIEEFR